MKPVQSENIQTLGIIILSSFFCPFCLSKKSYLLITSSTPENTDSFYFSSANIERKTAASLVCFEKSSPGFYFYFNTLFTKETPLTAWTAVAGVLLMLGSTDVRTMLWYGWLVRSPIQKPSRIFDSQQKQLVSISCFSTSFSENCSK